MTCYGSTLCLQKKGKDRSKKFATLCADNRLLRSLSHQPPPPPLLRSYFCSAAPPLNGATQTPDNVRCLIIVGYSTCMSTAAQESLQVCPFLSDCKLKAQWIWTDAIRCNTVISSQVALGASVCMHAFAKPADLEFLQEKILHWVGRTTGR